ncbi:MAG: carbohydrate kinase family protein [Thermoplasmata archaeon]|nr:carbohydrate kinase family protein [Thermoplasmata archaeon]
MAEFFLGVYGHTVLDHIITVPRLPPPNTSIELIDRQVFFGGTGANIARTASSLGVRTALSSFVGEDFPADYEEVLKRANVDTSELVKVEGYNTPVAWIFSDQEHNQICVIDQGPYRDSGTFEVRENTVRNSEIVHICTGRPEYYIKVVDLALELGRKVSFDPAQEIHYVYDRDTFNLFLRKTNHFFANENEIRTALKFTGLRKKEELAEIVDLLIVTLGGNGSLIFHEGEKHKIPAIRPDRTEEATGMGDAYRAGFYAAWSRGMDFDECGWAGSATASFAMESRGGQTNVPTWEDVLSRVEKAR